MSKEKVKIKLIYPPPLQGSRRPFEKMILLPNFSKTVLIFCKTKKKSFKNKTSRIEKAPGHN